MAGMMAVLGFAALVLMLVARFRRERAPDDALASHAASASGGKSKVASYSAVQK